jgi:amino acid adenylation domain-containing protein
MIINILDYLEQSANRLPHKKAIIDEHQSISFKTLRSQAKSLGNSISEHLNGGLRKPIVVFVDRSLDSIVTFLGVAYSGNFYVPIDKNTPLARIDLIMNTLDPEAMVVTPGSESLSVKLDKSPLKIDYQTSISAQFDDNLLSSIQQQIIDIDPLYATFTSGSTGVPKGVITCHRSVIDMTENLITTFNFDEDRVFGNQNPFYFDASIKDIYSALKCGASLYILPKSYFMRIGDLVEYMVDHEVDTILWSAAAIALLANAKAFEEKAPTGLKQVMFSGEVMHNKVLNYWRKKLPNTEFVNLYGPTEITSVCTYFKIDRPFEDDEVLPIGTPFNNCEVLILNEKDQKVKRHEMGELCVRGACLAMGYYNNPKKTQESFCQNPLNIHFPDLIYRTGDLARYNEEGHLIFVSRKDNQVKHMGQRVELGEIEILLNAMDLIEAAFCFYDHEKQKIVAVYQGKDADRKYIFSELREKVSKFMFPNVLIKHDALPYNLNGKIDRTLLKKEYESGELSA